MSAIIVVAVVLIAALGWRGSFVATAPVAFLLAGVWWWTTRDHPTQHPAVAQGEVDLIEAGRPPPETAARPGVIVKEALRNREILLLTASYFCMNYVFYLFFNWFFYYLVEIRGIEEERAGALNAAQWLIGAVGAELIHRKYPQRGVSKLCTKIREVASRAKQGFVTAYQEKVSPSTA